MRVRSPSLFGQNPYIKDRLSADFNGRGDLRIWVGEMAQAEADSLDVYIYPGFIYYVDDYDCIYRGSPLGYMIGFVIEMEKEPCLDSE